MKRGDLENLVIAALASLGATNTASAVKMAKLVTAMTEIAKRTGVNYDPVFARNTPRERPKTHSCLCLKLVKDGRLNQTADKRWFLREVAQRKNASRMQTATPYRDPTSGIKQALFEQAPSLESHARKLDEEGYFDPKNVIDARERIETSIVRRRGQLAFRKKLLTAYKGRCAITGCKIEEVLEAAHIISFKGPDTNRVANGLLLRADLHTLFDLSLLAVDSNTMTVIVSPVLKGSCYAEYQGKKLKLPDDPKSRPGCEALDQHRETSGL